MDSSFSASIKRSMYTRALMSSLTVLLMVMIPMTEAVAS
jgi:hypothetical protein